MQDASAKIAGAVDEHLRLAEKLVDKSFIGELNRATRVILNALAKGYKLLIFGNGGSAAEAQHFAAELVGRFTVERKALPAVALTTDTSFLTAQANDSGYATIFSRQIEALAEPGDIAFGMTTSDFSGEHSQNIRNAFLAARSRGIKTVGLFSVKTKKLLKLVDFPIIVPHTSTPRIQEIHLFVIHAIAEMIDQYYVKAGRTHGKSFPRRKGKSLLLHR